MSENMWEKQLFRHQGHWRSRRRRCSRHRSRGSPAARVEDCGEAGCPPAAHGGPWWSRYPHAAQGGPHTPAHGCARRRLWPCGEPALEQGPGRTCGPVERRAHTGAGLLAGLEQSVPEGLHSMEGANAGAVHEELQPMGRTHAGAVHGVLSPVRGTSHWSRARVWEVLPLRSGLDNVWWTDHNPHSPSPCAAAEGRCFKI